MPGFRTQSHKPAVENLIILILLAILAGILGGGMVGFATDHRVPSSTSSSVSPAAQ